MLLQIQCSIKLTRSLCQYRDVSFTLGLKHVERMKQWLALRTQSSNLPIEKRIFHECSRFIEPFKRVGKKILFRFDNTGSRTLDDPKTTFKSRSCVKTLRFRHIRDVITGVIT